MDKSTEKVIRDTFHIPDGELLTVWKLPGWRGCPLGDPDEGVTNCPLGFDTAKWSSNNPPSWMRERLSKQVLAHCQHCQGQPQPTPEEAQISTKIFKVITASDRVYGISTEEAKEGES